MYFFIMLKSTNLLIYTELGKRMDRYVNHKLAYINVISNLLHIAIKLLFTENNLSQLVNYN